MTVYTLANKPIIGVMVRLFTATGLPNTGAVTQNQWRALPSVASQYSLGFGVVSPLWSINTTTGVLTYNGPSRPFAIYGSISLGTVAGEHAFSFSHSAASILTTTNNSDFEGRQALTTGSESGINMSFVGAVTLSSGQTIQGAIRNVDGTGSMTIRRYQLLALPVGG